MPSGFPKSGTNKGWFIKKPRLNFICKTCSNSFEDCKKRTFCSIKCLVKWRTTHPSWNKGLPNTWTKGFPRGNIPWNKGIRWKEMSGSNHPLWLGGKDTWPKCSICGKTKDKYRTKTTLCGKCYMTFSKPENRPNWRGGINSVIKRRATLAGATGSHTQEEWENLKKKYNYICLCCKEQEPSIKLTEDHIVPLSLGGANDISNIQPLCLSCNSRKHTKIVNFLTYDLHKTI